MSLEQRDEYQIKTRFVLISRSKNKKFIQLMLKKVTKNVPWLFICPMEQPYYLTCCSSCLYGIGLSLNLLGLYFKWLKAVPCGPSHFYNSGLNFKLFDLYDKSLKGNFLWLKVPSWFYYNFLEASRIKLKH